MFAFILVDFVDENRQILDLLLGGGDEIRKGEIFFSVVKSLLQARQGSVIDGRTSIR